MRNLKKLAVIAIGGNALTADPKKLSISDQYETICELSEYLADMAGNGWSLLLVHGNGPQVGFILRRSELAMHEVDPVTMETAGADIQGGVGSMFVKALRNSLSARKLKLTPAALITHTLVSLDDPAFAHPSKPIGSWMEKERAQELAEKYNWTVEEDSGRGWRRVVPSPSPIDLLEKNIILNMLQDGNIVIAGGGGGIPVAYNNGRLEGVEAVIDKDRAAALLASSLKADVLLISTSVHKVAVNYGKPEQKWLDSMTLAEARVYMAEDQFGKGSMQPKVEALAEYVEQTGGTAIITSISQMPLALEGKAGTKIIKE